MKSRKSKIAQLPRDIRDELNWRIDNGEPGVQLLKWLNALPEVKKILDDHFDGLPINDPNLSDWKSGGHLDWRLEQETLAQAGELAEDGWDLEIGIEGRLADPTITVMTARYAALLRQWDGEVTDEFERKLRAMGHFTQALARLHRCHLASERLDMKKDDRELELNQAIAKAEDHNRFFKNLINTCFEPKPPALEQPKQEEPPKI